MIVQISMVRNELPLIKELLPVWKKFADGFVFLVDTTTDGTIEYLNQVKDEFNVLEILTAVKSDNKLHIETDDRQLLFDTGRKYSNKIICLDADEYLDGQMSKDELESFLDNNPDTLINLAWIQYTGIDTIRVDGPWGNNFKDRVGTYDRYCSFIKIQMHSEHLPRPSRAISLPFNVLFISHLQWINKQYVAIKQYYWKVFDYVNNKKYDIRTVGNSAYDASVNNFNWSEIQFKYPLKINPIIFDNMSIKNNYRLDYIKEETIKHNIPNLGDWGFDILNLK